MNTLRYYAQKWLPLIAVALLILASIVGLSLAQLKSDATRVTITVRQLPDLRIEGQVNGNPLLRFFLKEVVLRETVIIGSEAHHQNLLTELNGMSFKSVDPLAAGYWRTEAQYNFPFTSALNPVYAIGDGFDVKLMAIPAGPTSGYETRLLDCPNRGFHSFRTINQPIHIENVLDRTYTNQPMLQVSIGGQTGWISIFRTNMFLGEEGNYPEVSCN